MLIILHRSRGPEDGFATGDEILVMLHSVAGSIMARYTLTYSVNAIIIIFTQ